MISTKRVTQEKAYFVTRHDDHTLLYLALRQVRVETPLTRAARQAEAAMTTPVAAVVAVSPPQAKTEVLTPNTKMTITLVKYLIL